MDSLLAMSLGMNALTGQLHEDKGDGSWVDESEEEEDDDDDDEEEEERGGGGGRRRRRSGCGEDFASRRGSDSGRVQSYRQARKG